MEREAAEAHEARLCAIHAGRKGRLQEIDGFHVFLDEERYSPALIARIEAGNYETRERALVRDLLRAGDRVLEAGTAIGVVAMVAAARLGGESVVTFEADPAIAADARRNFAFNGLPIRSRVGVLRNRARCTAQTHTPFHVSRHFWSSRLGAKPTDADIVDTIEVAYICLEDAIASHEANVLVCDIEGGEVDLLTGADLSGIRLIVVEMHYWSVGEAGVNAMTRGLVDAGFNVDFMTTRGEVVVFRR